ncbi:uncharacterized protein HMPREF1120_01915 [Exophiala dermatitidis NIH/UT8656]|uniref:Uncharacterized protein n=1 Tax=Exophiala dermatitidis (strain ATCC 34100 / CBS 525.76 / NIH/UT8656) TaxID=858893 RepID=H6BQ08_EXODN|nr:uncharacterized protein HMPREF1120_01915 [Exophiala dermatitidis NIH/UT8656]EHY53731.1 hypothetical protein HMPREF1120_01915 [Exophiala dermatitidis NIH/UT8656]
MSVPVSGCRSILFTIRMPQVRVSCCQLAVHKHVAQNAWTASFQPHEGYSIAYPSLEVCVPNSDRVPSCWVVSVATVICLMVPFDRNTASDLNGLLPYSTLAGNLPGVPTSLTSSWPVQGYAIDTDRRLSRPFQVQHRQPGKSPSDQALHSSHICRLHSKAYDTPMQLLRTVYWSSPLSPLR